MKTMATIIGVSILALFAAVGFAQDYSGQYHGWGHMGGYGGPGWHHGEQWDQNSDWRGRHHGRGYRGGYTGEYHPCDYGWNRDQNRQPERPAPGDENR